MEKDVTNNRPDFAWLRQECLLIKSKRFHIFEPLLPDDFHYQVAHRNISMYGDYVSFLREFGYARFFTDHNDSPLLSVYPLKIFRQHICKDGQTYIGFGFRDQQSVYFNEQEILSTGLSKVYVVNKLFAREIAISFSDWLKTAYEWTRAKYSTAKWKKIFEGPKPFTSEEMQIIKARQQFHWRHIGFAPDGDALFEVKNNSLMHLPYLRIGIRDKKGVILVGGVYLDVSQIRPGEKATIKRGCYKDRISSSELEAFDFPDPIPEKRQAYWEFGKPG